MRNIVLPSRLYNVTFRMEDNTTRLRPLVPYSAEPDHGEDTETPRVCFADSIARCISAIGPSFRDLKVGGTFVLRSVSVSKLDKSLLIPPTILYGEHKVPDAMETHEYWYMSPIDVEVEKYEFLDFNYEHKVNWTCIPPEKIVEILGSLGYKHQIKGSTAYGIYRTAIGQLEVEQDYDTADEVYERVIELDWARGILVRDLKLRLIK